MQQVFVKLELFFVFRYHGIFVLSVRTECIDITETHVCVISVT